MKKGESGVEVFQDFLIRPWGLDDGLQCFWKIGSPAFLMFYPHSIDVLSTQEFDEMWYSLNPEVVRIQKEHEEEREEMARQKAEEEAPAKIKRKVFKGKRKVFKGKRRRKTPVVNIMENFNVHRGNCDFEWVQPHPMKFFRYKRYSRRPGQCIVCV
jgi:hypothetical protein